VDIDESDELGVRRISINPAAAVDVTVEVTVTKQDGAPANVSTDVSGKPYRYMDIDVSGASEDDIDNASIAFDVNKSWLENNSVDPEDVRLDRHVDDTWQPLPTNMTAVNNTSVAYEAVTDGFSYFAVAADDQEDEQNETAQPTGPVCGDDICNGNETWQTCQADCMTPAISAAQNAIEAAETVVNGSTNGSALLDQAQAAFDAGNYTQAEQLALQAQDAASREGTGESQKQTDEGSSLIAWIIGIVVLVLIALGLAFIDPDRFDDLVDHVAGEEATDEDDAEDRPHISLDLDEDRPKT